MHNLDIELHRHGYKNGRNDSSLPLRWSAGLLTYAAQGMQKARQHHEAINGNCSQLISCTLVMARLRAVSYLWGSYYSWDFTTDA